jgi:cell division septation protein DedD
MTALLFALALIAVGGYFYAKHRYNVWKDGAPERRAHRAKAANAAKRPLMQRIHTALGHRAQRLMRWTPDRGPQRVKVARRGLGVGRYEKIDPAQHIMAVGMTGSGKSSTLRVLAAWALLRPGWFVEAWDGKWCASVAPYTGKAATLCTIPEIEARLADLVGREFPMRAALLSKTGRVSHLALIMDESRLLNELSAPAMRDLVTVIQTGRELGVHCWFGLQDPKADSVPTEIRDQFNAKIVHQLQNAEAAQVAMKELVAAGWEPHKLMRPGQVYVWTPVSRPRVLFARWLDAPRLTALEVPAGPVADPALAPSPSMVKQATDRPTKTTGHRPVPTPGRAVAPVLTDRQRLAVQALGEAGALAPAELAGELGVDRRRAAEVLGQLNAKGLVQKHEPTGTYVLKEG